MIPFRRVCEIVAGLVVLAPSLALAVGSTPVNVVNPADIAKALGVGQPFQAQIHCLTPPGALNPDNCSGTLAMAAGQRLVIEYVSAFCLIDAASGHQLQNNATVSVTSAGTSIAHQLAIVDHTGAPAVPGSGINLVSLGQTVRLYADAGTGISVFAGTSGAAQAGGFPHCEFLLSGQAVSVP